MKNQTHKKLKLIRDISLYIFLCLSLANCGPGFVSTQNQKTSDQTLGEIQLKTVAHLNVYSRLTKQEYRYVTADLLAGGPASGVQETLATVEDFAENNYTGFYQNLSDINVYPGLEADQLSFAKSLAEQFLRGSLYDILCIAPGNCGDNLIYGLADWVWKRPLSEQERTELRAYYASFGAAERDFYLLFRLFGSPYFHYKIFEPNLKDSISKSYKVGNLLAFAITGSVPDKTLQNDIRRGEVTTAAQVEWHVRRLLASYPERFATLFVPQWLGLSSLYEGSSTYNGVSLRTVMTEPALIFSDVLKNSKTISPFIDLDANWVTPELAGLYGRSSGAGWNRMAVTQSLFGTAAMSYLTTDHDNGNPNPIRRGSHMVNHLLCKDLQFPSSAVQTQVDEIVQNTPEGLSPPKRLEHFRNHTACASCHNQFDFHGLALEEIGAFGERRTTYYTGDPVKAEGDVDGITFSSSVEFTEKLAQHSALNTCFASQVHSYLSSSDHLAINRTLISSGVATTFKGKSAEDIIVNIFLRVFGGAQ